MAAESVSIDRAEQITHHRFAARDFVAQAGTGSYLVNWRIGSDTIAAYTFHIVPVEAHDDPLIEDIFEGVE
ncbi:MAG: hypothetical protein ACYTGP_13250 [Planctomycetota bacterium]